MDKMRGKNAHIPCLPERLRERFFRDHGGKKRPRGSVFQKHMYD